MEKTISRWDKISSKGKKHHMYLGASLYRNVPLVLVLLIMMELMNNYRDVSMYYLSLNVAIKLVLAYVMGVYIGYLEWNLIEKLVENKFENNKSFRTAYIYTYGICMFGMSIMLANVDLYFMTFRRILIGCVIYPISGLMWGLFMSFTINRDIVK